ncbi:Major Facilitator Superfamily protein [Streptomyces sp. 2323.1]|uniref:MFS transporter n=1 Tax=Streptomyces sp. 2323.1 TaxID=1938841 RepID=UPI000BB89A51|nr:MFS transporter [Streptomyces sp. 2323.1]SOE13650.1 Major Facilitator Superfamily protein [Streptomyces sp. 2323.1]
MTSTESVHRTGADESPAHRRPTWLVLAVASVAVVIVPLGVSGTPLLLPGIGTDLGGGLAPLQWVVNAYNVAAASTMLATGVLADQYGRRRVFRLGAGLYLVSLLATILAQDTLVIDVARAAAGIGAGAIVTSMTAIVANAFDGPARAKAFGLVGVVIGAGLALGPTISGAIAQLLDWRAVFGFHAVIVALGLLGSLLLPESRNRGGSRFDFLGAGLFTVALLLLTIGTIEGPQSGWADVRTIALFAGAVLAFVLFVVHERRTSNPMFELSLFADRQFLTVNLVNIEFAFGFIGLLLLLPAFLFSVGGLGNGAAGLRILLLTVPIFLVPMVSGRLSAAGVPLRLILAGGLALIGVGAFGLTFAEGDSALWVLAVPLVVTGAGVGVLNGVMDGAAVGSVPNTSAGMAAGMFNTIRLAAESLASVVVVALVASFVHTQLSAASLPAGLNAATAADELAAGDVKQLFAQYPDQAHTLASAHASAFHQVMWISVVLAAVSVVTVLVLLRRQDSRR